jgi:hypothetical protein
MPWRAEWARVVAAPCAAHFGCARAVLAANENVAVDAAMWGERPCRELLVRSWERRGLEAHLDARSLRLRVLVRARLREPAEPDGWILVEPEYAELEVDRADLVETSLLAHVAVCPAELSPPINARALSRNRRLHAADLAAPLAWDWVALASNPGLAPERLLSMRGPGADAAFFAALSAHPALTMRLVRAAPHAPWCWYTLSALRVTPADRAGLPLMPGAVTLNSAFTDDDLAELGLERPRVCARHGYACAPSRGACGFLGAPVNWHVYVRLADDPARALQEALDANEDVGAMCLAAAGNARASIALVAWCLAKIRLAGGSRWACLTAAGNDLRADREKARAARAARRAQYPWIVRLCLRRALPISVARAVHACTLEPAARVARVAADRALVAFACAVRESSLWLPRADPLCAALGAK